MAASSGGRPVLVWDGRAMVDGMAGAETYGGKGLICDPIHHYIPFTRPEGGIPGEATEQDLIDTPWVQRLRRIPQLNRPAWWSPPANHAASPTPWGPCTVPG